MEFFVVLVVVLVLLGWAYAAGKRLGSRKGFGAGRMHARSRRRGSGRW